MAYTDGLAGFTNAANSIFSQVQHWDRIKEQRAQRELQKQDLAERSRLADQSFGLARDQFSEGVRQYDANLEQTKANQAQQDRQFKTLNNFAKQQYADKREVEILQGYSAANQNLFVKYGDDEDKLLNSPEYANIVNQTTRQSEATTDAFKDAFNFPKGTKAKFSYVDGGVVALVSQDGKTYAPHKGEDGKVKILPPRAVKHLMDATAQTFSAGDNYIQIVQSLTQNAGTEGRPYNIMDSIPYLKLQDAKNPALDNFSYTEQEPSTPEQDFSFNPSSKLASGIPNDYRSTDTVGPAPFGGVSTATMNDDVDTGKWKPETVAQSDKNKLRELEAALARAESNVANGRVGASRLAASPEKLNAEVQRIKSEIGAIHSRYTNKTSAPEGELNVTRTQSYIDELASKIDGLAPAIESSPELAQVVASTEGKRVTPRHEKQVADENAPMAERARAYAMLSLRQGKTPDGDTVTRMMKGDNTTADERSAIEAEMKATIEANGRYNTEMAKIRAQYTEKQFEAAKESRKAGQAMIDDVPKSLAEEWGVDENFLRKFRIGDKDTPITDKVAAIESLISNMIQISPAQFSINPEDVTPQSLAVLKARIREHVENSPAPSNGGIFSQAQPNVLKQPLPQSTLREGDYSSEQDLYNRLGQAASQGDTGADEIFSMLNKMPPAQRMKYIREQLTQGGK